MISYRPIPKSGGQFTGTEPDVLVCACAHASEDHRGNNWHCAKCGCKEMRIVARFTPSDLENDLAYFADGIHSGQLTYAEAIDRIYRAAVRARIPEAA